MLGNHRFFAILVLSVILSIAISNSQGINRMFSQDRRYFPTPSYQDPTGKIASSRSLNMTADTSNSAPEARQYDGGWGWNDGDSHSFFSSFGKGGDGPTHGGSGGWNSHGGAHSFFSESGRGGYGSSHGGGKGYGSSHGGGKGYGSSHGGGKGYGSSHGGGKGYGSSHGGGWSGGSYSSGSYDDHDYSGHGYQGPYYHRQQGGMELPIIGGLGALGLLGFLFYALSYNRPNTTVIIYNASGRRRRSADDFDSDYPLEGENWADLLSRVGKYFEKSWGGENASPKIKPFKLY